MSDDKGGINVVGQKVTWPESWPSMLTALSGCVAGVVIVAIVFIWADTNRFRTFARLIQAGVYSTNGKPSSDDDVSAIYRFWTPSMATKRDVYHKGESVPQSELDINLISKKYWASDRKPGESLEIEDQQFLDRLLLLHPVGINIYPMIGTGTTGMKHGYVWELSVSENNPISRSQLLSLYKDQWDRDTDIWLEEYFVQSTRK
jgi:hypothetical protein